MNNYQKLQHIHVIKQIEQKRTNDNQFATPKTPRKLSSMYPQSTLHSKYYTKLLQKKNFLSFKQNLPHPACATSCLCQECNEECSLQIRVYVYSYHVPNQFVSSPLCLHCTCNVIAMVDWMATHKVITHFVLLNLCMFGRKVHGHLVCSTIIYSHPELCVMYLHKSN